MPPRRRIQFFVGAAPRFRARNQLGHVKAKARRGAPAREKNWQRPDAHGCPGLTENRGRRVRRLRRVYAPTNKGRGPPPVRAPGSFRSRGPARHVRRGCRPGRKCRPGIRGQSPLWSSKNPINSVDPLNVPTFRRSATPAAATWASGRRVPLFVSSVVLGNWTAAAVG